MLTGMGLWVVFLCYNPTDVAVRWLTTRERVNCLQPHVLYKELLTEFCLAMWLVTRPHSDRHSLPESSVECTWNVEHSQTKPWAQLLYTDYPLISGSSKCLIVWQTLLWGTNTNLRRWIFIVTFSGVHFTFVNGFYSSLRIITIISTIVIITTTTAVTTITTISWLTFTQRASSI